jgi:predicted aspartyl protease
MELGAANCKICTRCALAALVALTGLNSPLTPAHVPDLPASASVASPGLITQVSPEESSAKPDYEAVTRPDQIGRIVVPVMVNNQGPFLFVLDTGATRTVLTPQLVTALGLPRIDDGGVTMNGATGSAIVPTAAVARVAAGDVVLENQQLPVAGALTTGIDGILGVDALEAKCVVVDFSTGKIEIRDARHQRPMQGAERLSAQSSFGGLLVVDAYVNRTHVKAVIDTGSESTLGNAALRSALNVHAQAAAANAMIDVLGETLALQRAERQTVATLRVGDVRADHFNIAFGEFYIFRLWNLDRQPALVIGMDLIGKLNAFAIDYERNEIQLRAQTQPARLTRQ